jgi:hypothetical protein
VIPFRHPHRPPSLRAAAGLAAAAVLALAGCGGSPHHGVVAKTRQAPPLQSIFTFANGGQLLEDPSGTLTTLRALGVNVVKLFLPWSAVAPDPASARPPAGLDTAVPSAYASGAFAPYDAVVRAAAARGVTVDLSIGGPVPQWATGAGAPRHGISGVWKPNARAFGAFVHAVAERYGGGFTPAGASAPLPRVRFWSVWNEPNYGQYLAPQAIDQSTVEVAPALYRRLLAAAWQALQSTGHGADTVLIGELAPRGITVGRNEPGNFSGMVPLRFLRALYCVNAQLQPLRGAAATARDCPATAAGSRAFAQRNPALFRASGLSDHPYPQGLAPTVGSPDEPDYTDFPALPVLERTLARIAADYGAARPLPIYSTEYGYRTDPPDTILRAVSPTTAALYMNEAEYLSWADPQIRSFDQYLLTDPPGPDSYATGLLFANGAPKPTLAAFRLPLFLPAATAPKGASVLVWGDVRPAAYLPHPQTVAIEYARSAAGPWRIVQRVTVSDPHGYFEVSARFPATGVVRLGFSPPGGPVEHSRVATVQIG